MKKIVSVTLLLFLCSNFYAQEWQTNFEDAKILASKNNQKIILVFQGSDWCTPCIKLDKEIWSTQKFQELASDKFIMLQADFPRRKKNKLSSKQQKHNDNLAKLYNNQGYFPLVVVLDYKGKALGKMGYEKLSPNQYYKKLASF